MKTVIVLAISAVLLFCFWQTSYSSSGAITPGSNNGEIYFTGPGPSVLGNAAVYQSLNSGADITIQFTNPTTISVGSLISDKTPNMLYRLDYDPYEFKLSDDGGQSWELVNGLIGNNTLYDAGCLEGEIYRRADDCCLERSTDFGENYILCSSQGIPDTSWIYSLALGSQPGEVYVCTYWLDLYRSDDFGETFSFCSNFWNLAEVSGSRPILKSGYRPGEIYFFNYNVNIIWQSADNGQSFELIKDFDVIGAGWLICDMTAGRDNAIYFSAVDINLYQPGGKIEIYVSYNNGLDWETHTHIISSSGITENTTALPNELELSIFPNPANPNFTVGYHLPVMSNVTMEIYNLRGQTILTTTTIQGSGFHQWQPPPPFNLASGNYFVILKTEQGIQKERLCIIK
ncbi:T9SS type A sorting domain-containing protein [Patescibacteria group bacterium]|nr:T9SS type A sorting domain-containing protein [Patescibacteria group bacterium]